MRRASWIPIILLLVPLPLLGQAEQATPERGSDPVEHRVQPGETLWSISRAYFGNPFQWRSILEANQDRIENANWIEPGQLLLIPGAPPAASPVVSAPGDESPTESATESATQSGVDRAAVQEIQVTTIPRQQRPAARSDAEAPPARNATSREGATEQSATTSPYGARSIFYTDGATGGTTGVSRSAASRVADVAVLRTAVPRDVYYAAGWLSPIEGDPGHVGRVAGFASDDRGRKTDRWAALPYDELHLELDGATAEVGDRYLTFHLGREIEYVGQVARPTGIVTVTRVTTTQVVAVLSDEYGRVERGDLVVPLADYPLAAGDSAEPVDDGPRGRIIAFQDPHLVKSLGAVAFIDLGSGDGISVGDELTVHAAAEPGGGSERTARGGLSGRLQVVGVHSGHSAARIVHVAGTMVEVGAHVQVVARLGR